MHDVCFSRTVPEKYGYRIYSVAKRTGFPSYFHKYLKNKHFFFFNPSSCRSSEVRANVLTHGKTSDNNYTFVRDFFFFTDVINDMHQRAGSECVIRTVFEL